MPTVALGIRYTATSGAVGARFDSCSTGYITVLFAIVGRDGYRDDFSMVKIVAGEAVAGFAL